MTDNRRDDIEAELAVATAQNCTVNELLDSLEDEINTTRERQKDAAARGDNIAELAAIETLREVLMRMQEALAQAENVNTACVRLKHELEALGE